MADRIKELASKFPNRTARAVNTRAEILLTEAKRRTPVAPNGGTLRASGKVDIYRNGKFTGAIISFGGAASDYAIAVHEHLSEHSPYSWAVAEMRGTGVHWTTPGTGPKFLEGPINEAQPTMGQEIADMVHFDRGLPW